MGIFLFTRKIRSKLKYILVVAAAFFACAFMVFFPEISILSAQKSIAIWANSILPAMLPFFICANFMNGMGITRYLNPGGFAFAMSALSGYPMGAKVIGDMGRKGYITTWECHRLISFCSTSGPAFIVGVVGASIIGNNVCGSIIAIAHFGGALLNGVIFTILIHILAKNQEIHKKTKRQKSLNENFSENYLEIFTESIVVSFKSLGIILAYIVMFMMLTDVIEMAGFLNFLQNSCSVGVIKGILEMTVGCSAIGGAMTIPIATKTVVCCVLISFGGLSIIGQSMSMLNGTKISLPYLLVVKASHGALAGAIAFLMTQIML